MAATYRAVINGVDRADTHVLLDGFKINEVTNGINTLVCEVGSEDASFRPVKRQTIEIYEDDGTSPERLIFGGTIRMVRERGWGEIADGINGIIQAVSADSYKTLASRRFVTASYPSQSLEATFTSVVNTYLAAYSVTVDPAQATGPTLEAMEFEVVRVDDVFNFLATLTAKYGAPFIWTIGYDKVAGMYQTGTVAAPWNLLESDFATTYSHVGDIEVEPTDESYANKIILVWGSGTVIAVDDDTFVGDGITTTFTLSFQLVGPGIPQTSTAVGWGYVTRAGIFFETLGDLGTGAMWEYDPVANTITRTIGAPALGEVITIDYHGESKGTVIAQDAGEIASFGLWEDKILAPEIENATLAQTVADAELQRRIVTGRIVRFRTARLPAPVPGETITITVPKRNISGAFTVTDVATENYPGDVNTLIRTVTCGFNIHEQSHQTLTRWWSEKDTNGIATPTGSGAVPGPPPYSAQWNDSTSGKALFGGAWNILYGPLFWDLGSPQNNGWHFVTEDPATHIGLDDPQRLEMGMLSSGDFSMDLFAPGGQQSSILMNAPGDIDITAGLSILESPAGFGSIILVANQSILGQIAALSGIQPGVETNPGAIGDSFSRFTKLNALDGVAGFYRTVSSLPFSIQVTGTEADNEFWTYIVTAGTGTIFLPWIGTAGTPNYRSFPVTAVGRMYWIVNDGGGTLTVDAGTAGTNINDASTITLADKAAVKVQRHDDGWRILASFGTVTGGGAATVTPGGNDKDVQFNDGGVFGGENAFEYDKTKDQLALTDNVGTYSPLRLMKSGNDNAVTSIRPQISYSEISFGREVVANVDTARTANPGYVWWNDGGFGSPAVDGIGLELELGETPGSAMTYASVRGVSLGHDGLFRVYQSGGLGSGSPGVTGMGVQVDRNDDGNGAAAYLSLQDRDGVRWYQWVDDEGIPRHGTAPPQEDGTPSDTSGLRLSPMQIVVKASDESVANDTLQNDDELLLTVGTNEVWIFDLVLFVNSGTSNAPDIKWDFTLPASATIKYGVQGLSSASTAINAAQFIFGVETASVVGSAGVLTTATIETMPVFITGTIRTAGTAGTVQFRWAQLVTTGGSPTVVRADSYWKAYRVS